LALLYETSSEAMKSSEFDKKNAGFRRKDRKSAVKVSKESEAGHSKQTPKMVLQRNANCPDSKSQELMAKASDSLPAKANSCNKAPEAANSSSARDSTSKPTQPSNRLVLSADYLTQDIDCSPIPVCNLINGDSWEFDAKSVVKHLLPVDAGPPGAVAAAKSCPSFTVLGAVGKQSVGKSMLLNQIAGSAVFDTHTNCDDPAKTLLQHVTNGVNLYATSDRLWLLDTQVTIAIALIQVRCTNRVLNRFTFSRFSARPFWTSICITDMPVCRIGTHFR
jgi:hypothetical protein